jgi:hypothetical protein
MTFDKPSNVPDALQQWRVAERAAAVARRGTLAAQTAAEAAADAAEAAIATAEAARSALSAMTLAETSASKTAAAAKLAARSTRADMVDTQALAAMADVDEAEAHARYQTASDRAAGGGKGPASKKR